MMHIASLVVGPLQSNCHILSNDERDALVIDPGDEAERILAYLDSEDLTVIGYPLTHGHVDHVSALAQVYAERPAPVGMHPIDLAWSFSERNQIPTLYASPTAPPEVARHYEEGQTWLDGGWSYRVLHTPGHSPGSVSFYFEEQGVLIAGDVLFRGSVGRSDLPGGNPRTMSESLRRFAELPDATRVYCGHGPSTTIGEEKRSNFFMQNLPGRARA